MFCVEGIVLCVNVFTDAKMLIVIFFLVIVVILSVVVVLDGGGNGGIVCEWRTKPPILMRGSRSHRLLSEHSDVFEATFVRLVVGDRVVLHL